MIPNLAIPVSGVSPVTVGGLGTTAKIFPAPANAGSSLTSAAILSIPANGQYEGQPFGVTIAGTVVTGTTTTPTLNFVLQSGTSLTAASNTTVATLTAAFAAAISTKYNFCFSVLFVADSASGKLQGVPNLSACSINGANQAITITALSGINFLSGAATGANPIFNRNVGNVGLNLVAGVTFGVSDAANSSSLMAFYID